MVVLKILSYLLVAAVAFVFGGFFASAKVGIEEEPISTEEK